MSCYLFPPFLLHNLPRPSFSSPSPRHAPLCHRSSHLLPQLTPQKPITSSLIRTPIITSLRSTTSPCRQLQRHHTLQPGQGDVNNNGGGGSDNNGGNNNNNGGDGHHSDREGDGDDNQENRTAAVALASLLSTLCYFRFFPFLALAKSPPPSDGDGPASILAWEVRGGKWNSLAPDLSGDELLVDGRKPAAGLAEGLLQLPLSLPNDLDCCWKQCRDVFLRLMLPEGYPHSVTTDYLEYSLWRGVQGIASQISGVLSTQALLFAVGLGKGAIPTAAAVNWVLKDGIGYLSKILLSKFGRHFDVNPKGWRLFADLLENTAYGLEIVTPALPHLFVPIGAVAGSSRSAAYLIQAATKNSFNAGFAAQRNFAEVIAKGEAQGMVSKFVGIVLGIALANCTGSSTPLTLSTFGIVSAVHMYCNLKSYQSIQLRTLNPYRASLVFSEYLLSGQVPLVKEVNNEEPLFPGFPLVNLKSSSIEEIQVLTPEAKDSALQIANRLKLGCKLSDVINNEEEACLLFELFKHEKYMLAEKQGEFCVILKADSLPEDMLKSVFHVNYLYWLERNVRWLEPKSIGEECKPGGRLHISMEYVQREFDHVKHDGQLSGWVTDGLVARPLPYRICPGYDDALQTDL